MSSGEANAELANNGWAAVPRSHSKALEGINKSEHAKLDFDSVKVPDVELARKVFDYAKATLPERTFNHSMRVWNYGESYIGLPNFVTNNQSCWAPKNKEPY